MPGVNLFNENAATDDDDKNRNIATISVNGFDKENLQTRPIEISENDQFHKTACDIAEAFGVSDDADFDENNEISIVKCNNSMPSSSLLVQKLPLATVMENLPLSQDSFNNTQKIVGVTGNCDPDVDNLSLSDKFPVEGATNAIEDAASIENDEFNSNNNENKDENNHMSLIGHSRSAHSFGPGDYVNNDQHRRTHFRHNSYEVTGINSNNNNHNGHSMTIGGQLHHNDNLLAQQQSMGGISNNYANFIPFVNRTNSLSSKTNDYSSYSSSSFSVSSLSCSDYSASINDEQSSDSGNISKRSSLDRRSLASVSENNSEINNGSRPNAGSHNNQEEWRFKRLPQISSILPKGLFSRRSSNSISSVDSSQSDNSNSAGGCGPVDLIKTKFFRPSSANSSQQSNSSINLNNGVVSKEEVASTTALILENRPKNLPPKSAEEEHKHKLLYEQMVEAAKKKEQKEAKLKKKLHREQLKQEEVLSAAVREWTNEILPKWDELKSSKRTKELWGQGLPPCIRGKVWKLAIGNELSITEELFEICVNRAKERLQQFEEATANRHSESANSQPKLLFPESSEDGTTISGTSGGYTINDSSPVDREGTVELIHLDVARTFPTLGIFQKGGPYYDLLLNVLGAYVCYRPDVGYVQGMSFLAAILLLNLDVADAFIAFANLMNRPCQLAFFRLRHLDMQRYFQAYDMYFECCLPKLYSHFRMHDIRPNLYLIEWIYTLYAKSLPLEITCRIWDSFLRDGEEFLFKTAIGILFHFEDILLRMDFDRCVQFLTHLPDNLRDKDLFSSIDRIKHGRDHKKFGQILCELSSVPPTVISSNNTSPINTSNCSSPANKKEINNPDLSSAKPILIVNYDFTRTVSNKSRTAEDTNGRITVNSASIKSSTVESINPDVDSNSCDEQTPVADDDDDAVVIIPL